MSCFRIVPPCPRSPGTATGYVLLLSSKTKQWAADFKLNSTATAVAFSPDSRYVLASSADADVYKFDIRSRRCILRFFNEVFFCLVEQCNRKNVVFSRKRGAVSVALVLWPQA